LKYCAASGGYFPADILKRRLRRAFLATIYPADYFAQYRLFRAAADRQPADYLPEGYRFPQHYHRSGDHRRRQQRAGDLFYPFNAFIVAIGLYWAISILLELLIKRLSAWEPEEE
jgi:hypothetical protein